jgi:transcriptional regulator with XRE-family HTH domain
VIYLQSPKVIDGRDRLVVTAVIKGRRMGLHQEFSLRVRKACEEKGLKTTQKALAKFFGVSEITARNWWHGEKLPGMQNAIDAAVKLGVNVEWFLTGRGPMRPEMIVTDKGSEDRAENLGYDFDPSIIEEILDIIEERRRELGDPQPLNRYLAAAIADTYGPIAREKKIDYRTRIQAIVDESLRAAAEEKKTGEQSAQQQNSENRD